MPQISANGIKIYYEEAGSGEPLVFISGLGGTNKLWYWQSLYFKNYYRVITFDNRGVGQTDKPENPYSMEMLTEDLYQLLDKIGIRTPVYLVGASMGGLIAQNFIHQYPEKVKKLTLCCTGVSLLDPRFCPAEEEVVNQIFIGGQTKEEYVDNILSAMYFPEFVKQNPQVRDMLLNPSVEQQPAYAYQNQLKACLNNLPFYEWLAEIKVPTLLMHGREDRVFPIKNAFILKEGLQEKGELFIMEKAAHVFFQEKPAEFNARLHEFLKK